jgi:2-polyprenyl-3-methyl-5-hydroxy-6-metoxy-1,4-benzoquinol methylase
MRTTQYLLALILFATVSVSGQTPRTPDELEARIANLAPERRSYERFRYWLTTQLPEVQRSADRMDRYAAYLKTRGFNQSEITTQVKLVSEQGKVLEVQRWNTILTAEKPRFNTNPNAFLVEMAKSRTPGTALDVGMGQGRNAIWLAQNGWDVTGFDPAEKAVELAKQTAQGLGVHLNTEVTTMENFDFGENRWDLILLSYVGARELSGKFVKALKPNGILVIEAFHRDATRGDSIGPAVVFDTGELIRLFPNLRVARYEEPVVVPDFSPKPARIVRYCGEKVE